MIYTTDLIQAKFEMFSIDGKLMSVYGSKTIAEYIINNNIDFIINNIVFLRFP